MIARKVTRPIRWRFPLFCFGLIVVLIIAVPLLAGLAVWLSHTAVGAIDAGLPMPVLIVLSTASLLVAAVAAILMLARWIVIPALILVAATYMIEFTAEGQPLDDEES